MNFADKRGSVVVVMVAVTLSSECQNRASNTSERVPNEPFFEASRKWSEQAGSPDLPNRAVNCGPSTQLFGLSFQKVTKHASVSKGCAAHGDIGGEAESTTPHSTIFTQEQILFRRITTIGLLTKVPGAPYDSSRDENRYQASPERAVSIASRCRR